jgi:hypothetical protein
VTPERRVAPPGGMAAPSQAHLDDGTPVDLEPLARRITERHLQRHPEDIARYGDEMARTWCTHDNQHLLGWAIADVDLNGQLAWLARVLDARGYPVANLADNVVTGAEVMGEMGTPAARAVAERMRAAAGGLSRPSS